MRTYTSEELEELPTLSEGYTQDLKVDDGDFRVWLSRIDNEPEYEIRYQGRWHDAQLDEGDSGEQFLVVRIDADNFFG